MSREPNMLSGSSGCGHGEYWLPRHGQTTQPAWRADLNYRVFATEQSKSVSLPAEKREGTSQDGLTAVRTADQGGSEGFSVMEEIPVASMHGNITGRESGQTSLRY